MVDDPITQKINQKFGKAAIPALLNPVQALGYYPDTDLLICRCGGVLVEGVFFTINRQNLVRFFEDLDALQAWLRGHRYEEIPQTVSSVTAQGPKLQVVEGSGEEA
jgi:hypothetical protein